MAKRKLGSTVSQSRDPEPNAKRQKFQGEGHRSSQPTASQRLLCQFYPRVTTLRTYLLAKLPYSSRSRRNKIGSLQRDELRAPPAVSGNSDGSVLRTSSQHSPGISICPDKALAQLLDSAIVGYEDDEALPAQDEALSADLKLYSQSLRSSGDSRAEDYHVSQSDLVDFVISTLFHTIQRRFTHPTHILCHGFRRPDPARYVDGIRGTGPCKFESVLPNSSVTTLKGSLWCDLLKLLGKDGERMMVNLLLSCGVYLPLKNGKGNLFQLSGVSLSELRPLGTIKRPKEAQHLTGAKSFFPRVTCRSPNDIFLVRNRMMHARAALNAKQGVRFGLRHIHVLNRFGDLASDSHTIHIMKYLFPRQFGLHNVFQHDIDRRETAHPFKDYTLREQEIAENQADCKSNADAVPKRLRGKAVNLVKRLQKLHSRCSYVQLLRHYCPNDFDQRPWTRTCRQGQRRGGTGVSDARADVDQGTCPNQPLIDAATPMSQVSAFCRAVLASVVPREFLGYGEAGLHNWNLLLRNVDRFIRCSRFESLNLDSLLRGMKISSIPWLAPSGLNPGFRMSQSDFRKRKEIFSELVYYVFDSFLIPVIRSNFYVTESTTHKTRIFYFRHDMWLKLTDLPLATLKASMFEELPTQKTHEMLESRKLGHGQVRLVPKGRETRPVMNLSRKAAVSKNEKSLRGKSINEQLRPVQSMLNYEKTQDPERLGSSLFSVQDIFPKLRAFRSKLRENGNENRRLYFAKVDVKGCFDSIPQGRAVEVVSQVCGDEVYRITKHMEIKERRHGPKRRGNNSRSFVMQARSGYEFNTFEEHIDARHADGRTGTIFVESGKQTVEEKRALLKVLTEHVQQHVVKVGNKFLRQKRGIPQGSVVSSLLCSFFYADFEREHLGFLLGEGDKGPAAGDTGETGGTGDSSLLLRLIDDFLLITTDEAKARRFLEVMHAGSPTYGIQVRAEKSLCNFACRVDGVDIGRSTRRDAFPYCGILIGTRSLEVRRDRGRGQEAGIRDSLTIESGKLVGEVFRRKTIK